MPGVQAFDDISAIRSDNLTNTTAGLCVCENRSITNMSGFVFFFSCFLTNRTGKLLSN